MYTQRIILQPAVGKAGELQSFLKERLQQRNQQGGQLALATRMFGGPVDRVTVSQRFDTLAALEQQRRAVAADPATTAAVQRINALVSGPATFELSRHLIPVSSPSGAAAPVYLQRVTFFPAMGKLEELQGVVKEWCEYGISRGDRVGMASQLFTQGGAFVVSILFSSFDEFEQTTARWADDATFNDFARKASALYAAPFTNELYDILVPFPSA